MDKILHGIMNIYRVYPRHSHPKEPQMLFKTLCIYLGRRANARFRLF